MSCGSRCYIVNEAHGLTKEQVRRLLKVTEAPYLNERMTWVFTTTLEGQITFADGKEDAGPLLSRCIRYELEETQANAAMATRLHEIAKLENLDGQDYAAYEALLVNDCDSNMREALQVIARGGMMSPITKSPSSPPRRRTA